MPHGKRKGQCPLSPATLPVLLPCKAQMCKELVSAVVASEFTPEQYTGFWLGEAEGGGVAVSEKLGEYEFPSKTALSGLVPLPSKKGGGAGSNVQLRKPPKFKRFPTTPCIRDSECLTRTEVLERDQSYQVNPAWSSGCPGMVEKTPGQKSPLGQGCSGY